MYAARLAKEEGAQLMRMRWYGTDLPTKMYAEIKTHRCEIASSKDRFAIEPTQAVSLLNGTTGWIEAGKKNKTCKNVKKMSICNIMLGLFQERHVQSSLRTEYLRTAFESDSEKRYRVSLDEKVVLRQDIGLRERLLTGATCAWSSSTISEEQPVVELPFCILEVKIQKGFETSGVDDWVWQLVNEGKVQVEDSFSKYGAGCSLFYPSARCVRASPTPNYMNSDVGDYLRAQTAVYSAQHARHGHVHGHRG